MTQDNVSFVAREKVMQNKHEGTWQLGRQKEGKPQSYRRSEAHTEVPKLDLDSKRSQCLARNPP